jgi:TPR repeat protein
MQTKRKMQRSLRKRQQVANGDKKFTSLTSIVSQETSMRLLPYSLRQVAKILLVVILGIQYAHAEEPNNDDEWINHESKTYGFVIQFPNRPTTVENVTSTANDIGTLELFLKAEGATPGISYQLQVYSVLDRLYIGRAGAIGRDKISQLMKASSDVAISAINGKKIADCEIMMFGNPGRSFTALGVHEGLPAMTSSRSFLKDRKLYLLQVVRTGAASVSLTDAMHFFGSFKNTFTPPDSRPFDFAKHLEDEIRTKASSGDAESQYQLGTRYFLGAYLPKNAAATWYRKAAEQGHVEAQDTLGFMYRNGNCVPQNDAEAVKWHRMAAEQGHPGSQESLGIMYRDGEGVPKNAVEAVKLFQSAAEHGRLKSKNYLGMMYYSGKSVVRDDVEAVKLFREAAEQGFPAAQANLGMMFYNGRGTPEDNVEGYAWCVVSAANGFESAKDQLPKLEKHMTSRQIADGQKRATQLFDQINANKEENAKITP